VRQGGLGELLCQAVRLLARQSSLKQLACGALHLNHGFAPDVRHHQRLIVDLGDRLLFHHFD
jgi:hypothetical protein